MITTSAAALIDFEAQWGRHSSAKEVAILDTLGLRPSRFYQLLHRAARSKEGIAHDPITCRRVRERAQPAS